MLLGTISAQGELEKAFTAISKLKGFKTYYNEQQLINGWGAENHLDCFSEVKTTCANADSQEQLLSILETIPKEILEKYASAKSDDTRSLSVCFIEEIPCVYYDEIYFMNCYSYEGKGSYETLVKLSKACFHKTN